LHAFIYDIKRVTLYNRSTIVKAPLQIYCSALIFAPEMSIVRGQFKDQIPYWVCGLPRVQRDWSSLEQTLEGHSDPVKSVAFSHDGSRLASGSDDCTVRVWNVATGQVEQTLGHSGDGHSGRVNSVAFSHDGSRLASGSDDRTVRVWNVATGQVEQTLEGHSGSVNSVISLSDGSEFDSFYSVDGSGDWVMQDGSRILYLPFNCRPGQVATRGRTLAIGAQSGRVTIISFS